MADETKEIQQVLGEGLDEFEFEPLAGEITSPLNAPVIEKNKQPSPPSAYEEGGENPPERDGQGPFPPHSGTGSLEEEAVQGHDPYGELDEDDEEPDAPEQQIADDYDEGVGEESLVAENFELPAAHAKQAADTLLGMTDNFLEIGGGFFVKVKKHADFYDFDEIIQVIDEHNEKNVKKLRLEKEDKALLKPLLVSVLQKKAKKLTPEQQLMGAVLSILIKKAQLVMEVRAENELLVDRILLIIREERGATAADDETPHQEEEIPEEEEGDYIEEELVEEIPVRQKAERTPKASISSNEPTKPPPMPMMDTGPILEVADDDITETKAN
ncbi:MAG: hypothetical protein AAGA66_20500 [Bacteroidota bacterium]